MRIRHGTFDWDSWEEASGAWYAALRGGRLGFSGADEAASRLCVLGLNLAIAGAMHASFMLGWQEHRTACHADQWWAPGYRWPAPPLEDVAGGRKL